VDSSAREAQVWLDDDAPVPLRLTVARGALGLELYQPVDLGPIEVTHLSLTLPGLRFPLDLSGGVPKFRHRRGDLERLELTLSLDALGRWLSGRFGHVIGPLVRPPSVWASAHAISVGLSAEASALAFDLLWAPEFGDARFVVGNARGAGLAGPALGFALRALDSVAPGFVARRGRAVFVAGPAQRITRALLPAVGARAPSAGRVRFAGELSAVHDQLSVALDSSYSAPRIADDALRAQELAALTVDADDALASGDLDRARAGYLLALEHAPRHPEIVRVVAEIDRSVDGRAEAALGLVVEAMPALGAGIAAAELLARTGDLDGAREGIAQAARTEPFAPVAALWYARLAEIERSAPARLHALDEAVARCPSSTAVRWARFDARIERRDVEGALADFEGLEAGTPGSRARYAVCERAARALMAAGFVHDAGKLFERALRYLPDDVSATVGLARALMEAGRADRATVLLTRAVALAERKGNPNAEALLDLAKLLATRLRDLPQAIARVRQVSSSSPAAPEARFREGAWRAELGDIAGASQAFARFREAVELGREHAPGAAAWLAEAARFERNVAQSLAAAERHLALALRLTPHVEAIAAEYREVARELAEAVRASRTQ
jgi:tetratricopeptide (TPR) repeat protein